MAAMCEDSIGDSVFRKFQHLVRNQNLYGLFHTDLSVEVRKKASEIIGQQMNRHIQIKSRAI